MRIGAVQLLFLNLYRHLSSFNILKSRPTLNPKCPRRAGSSHDGKPPPVPLDSFVELARHLTFFVRYAFKPDLGMSRPGPPTAQMYWFRNFQK
jgi:hypothetical protein